MVAVGEVVLDVSGSKVALARHGSGQPVLLLHSHMGFWHSEPFIAALAEKFTVLVPSHPGFEASPVDPSLNSVDDLAYLYLDLLDQLGEPALPVVGLSLGAWIAAEMAIKDQARIASLVLVSPTGVHFGGPEDESIADVFLMHEQTFAQRAFFEESAGRKNFPAMTDDELLIMSRNREAAARYAWMPCFYDPKLRQRLHRIKRPTLILRGDADEITDRAYADSFTASIDGAKLATIAKAGHFPAIEQPAALVEHIAGFIA